MKRMTCKSVWMLVLMSLMALLLAACSVTPTIAPIVARETPTIEREVPRPRPPSLSVSVHWVFDPGSSGIAPSPNRWSTVLTLESRDTKNWTLVPDMLFGETLETDALATGLSLPDNEPRRQACVPFLVEKMPSDDSGRVSRTVVGASGEKNSSGEDLYTIALTEAEAHWRINDQDQPWQPTDLQPGDTLTCEWEDLSFVTFTPEVKQKDAYYLFHLGPIVYDQSSSAEVAYLLVARSGPSTSEGEQWQGEDVEFIPLTADVIREQVDDATRPIEWRAQFLTWLWDQPRPVAGADQIMLNVLNDARYPVTLQSTAARGLLERQYAPAIETLLSIAQNKAVDAGLRLQTVRGLYLVLSEDEASILSVIARDTTDAAGVREAALQSLAQMGEPGWAVIGELTDDEAVGETAMDLLESRDESNP